MGHLRLYRLPRTRKWKEVVALLADKAATVEEIAAASIEASKAGLKEAAKDPSLVYTFWLLTQIPLAARREQFVEELNRIGLPARTDTTAAEIAAEVSRAIDRSQPAVVSRSDIGEMARLAAAECLTSMVSIGSTDLFESGAHAAQNALKPFSTERNFGLLARDFFSRFIRRYLTYYLSRETPNHVGEGRRFRDSNEHSEFNQALDLHCRQAARIVQDFAGGWMTKTDYEGGITPERTRGFMHVALGKLRDELAQGAAEG